MNPAIRNIKKKLTRALEAAEIKNDASAIASLSRVLLTVEESIAAEAAAEAAAVAAAATPTGRSGITEIRHVIVRMDGWEQHLTDDERRQLQALRASADRRAGVVAPRSPSDSTPDSARGH